MTLKPQQQKAIDLLALAVLAEEPHWRAECIEHIVGAYRSGITALYPEYDAAIIDDACRRFEGLIVARLAEVSPTGEVGHA